MDSFGRTTNIYQNMYKDTSRRLNGIWHVIFLWKGSVFKLMWHDILVFTLLYGFLAIVYRTILFEHPVPREIFEIVCIYAGKFSALIPISFLTGFYVSQVVSRWWDQFMSLPWPDKIALRLVSYCPGKDLFRKNLRRTVMRYINLSTILVYRLVSTKVKSRFPTYKEMVEARLILPHEVDRLLTADAKTPHESTWTPILWAVKLLQRARTEGKIKMEPAIYANLISSIDYIESSNRKILNYGWINFPLAYTQVATLSVFCYFVAALFGRQYLIPREVNQDNDSFPNLNISYSNTEPFNNHTPDFFFPVFTYVELLSYMGWIKVAETLLNPFGDDDEDFQVNYMIDRNLQVSYLIVDEAEEELEMAEDPFLEAGIAIPTDLPSYVNKSSKAPLAGGDSLDLVRVDSKDSGGGGGGSSSKQIIDTFKSLRLRRNLTAFSTSFAGRSHDVPPPSASASTGGNPINSAPIIINRSSDGGGGGGSNGGSGGGGGGVGGRGSRGGVSLDSERRRRMMMATATALKVEEEGDDGDGEEEGMATVAATRVAVVADEDSLEIERERQRSSPMLLSGDTGTAEEAERLRGGSERSIEEIIAHHEKAPEDNKKK